MTPRTDAHQHFWTLVRTDYGWLTTELGPLYRDFQPADLAPLLVDGGIAVTILVQAAPTVEETRHLLRLADHNAWIAGVVGWIDMASGSAANDLAELAEHPKLVGIRPMLQDLADPAWIVQPELATATEALVANGLRFDALVRPDHLPHLLKFLQRHPDLMTVIDHAAKPNIAAGQWQPWADLIAEIAGTTRAYCKLSGLLTEATSAQGYEDIEPYMEHLLAAFGPERLMWGSDWPVLNLAGNYRDWLAMAERFLQRLDQGDREQVLGGTAIRFYGLRVS